MPPRLSTEVWLGSAESPNAQPPIPPAKHVGRSRVLFELFAEIGMNDFSGERQLAERRSNAFDIRFAEWQRRFEPIASGAKKSAVPGV